MRKELLELLEKINELESRVVPIDFKLNMREKKIKALQEQYKQGTLEFKWSNEATSKLIKELV